MIRSSEFRDPELPVSKPVGKVSLTFLGRATTYGLYVDHVTTSPHRVTQALQAAYPT